MHRPRSADLNRNDGRKRHNGSDCSRDSRSVRCTRSVLRSLIRRRCCHNAAPPHTPRSTPRNAPSPSWYRRTRLRSPAGPTGTRSRYTPPRCNARQERTGCRSFRNCQRRSACRRSLRCTASPARRSGVGNDPRGSPRRRHKACRKRRSCQRPKTRPCRSRRTRADVPDTRTIPEAGRARMPQAKAPPSNPVATCASPQ